MATMLADKRVALFLFTSAPAGLSAGTVTVEEIDEATNHACNVFKADTYLRATGSESVTDPLLCGGLQQGFGNSNYEGQISIARFLDANGVAIDEEDVLWDAAREKGTKLYLGMRVGPKWDAPGAKDQEISIFEVITDNPQDPQAFDGYIKKIVPLGVQNAWLDLKVTAA